MSKRKEMSSGEPQASGNDGFIRITDMPMEGYNGPSFLSNVDMTTKAGKMLVVNLESGAGEKGGDLDGMVWRVRQWVATIADFASRDTGETRRGLRLAFIDPDGQVYTTTSEVVAKTWDKVRQVYGDDLGGDIIYIQIHKVSRGSRNTFHSITVIDESQVTDEMRTWDK